MPTYDVCVIGAGPAGAAAATLLVRNGRTVLIAEAGDFSRPRPGEHLTPEIIPALHVLGVAPEAHQSPGTVSLWGTARPVVESGLERPLGGCLTVRRGEFDRCLAEAASRDGAELSLHYRLLAADPLREGWSLAFDTPTGEVRVAARCVIDASGRHMAFARRQGARIQRDDKLVAMVSWTVPLPEVAGACRMLHVESVQGGWWYAVALPDDTIVAAFLTNLERVRREGARFSDVWADAIQASQLVVPKIGAERLERLRPRVYPAAPGVAEPLFGRDWLSIGDAAAQFDPLEGRGVRRALELAFRGSEVMLLNRDEREAVLPLYRDGVRAMVQEHRAARRQIYAEAANRLGQEFFTDLADYSM